MTEIVKKVKCPFDGYGLIVDVTYEEVCKKNEIFWEDRDLYSQSGKYILQTYFALFEYFNRKKNKENYTRWLTWKPDYKLPNCNGELSQYFSQDIEKYLLPEKYMLDIFREFYRGTKPLNFIRFKSVKEEDKKRNDSLMPEGWLLRNSVK